jgi:tetratricopeptide (TPR) repeat protein
MCCRLLLLSLLISACPSFAQNDAIYKNLPVGKFPVGFKIITVTDKSRVTKSLYDYDGNIDTTDRYKKVKILVWYPALPGNNSLLSYEDYCYNHLLNGTNDQLSPDRKNGQIANTRDYFQGYFGPVKDDDWKKLLAVKLLARKEAQPVIQRFPLLIGVLRPLSTTITNEMLASNGYVVAMVMHSGGNYPMGYISEITDMQKAIEILDEKKMIDVNSIGTYGFSGSGFTQILFAMYDQRIRALADIESGLYMDGLLEILSSSNFYNPRKLQVPFLHLFSKDLSKEEKGIDEFKKKKKFSDRYQVLFNQSGMHHWDFATEGRVSNTVFHMRGQKEKGLTDCFELFNQYLLNFFNATLRNQAAARQFLEKADLPAYSDSLWTVNHFAAINPPPDKDQFVAIINKNGLDSGVAIARRFFIADPEAEFLHENVLNQLARDYRAQEKKEQAMGLMKLAVELHPKEAWLWGNLADMQESFGNIPDAISSSEKVVELLKDYKGTELSYNERVRRSALATLKRLKK